MTGFIISINDVKLTTVSTKNINVLTIGVHGDRVSPELAFLDVGGGVYSETESEYLTWVEHHEIFSNDVLKVEFSDELKESNLGKTIEELYPESVEKEKDIKPFEEVFKEFLNKPILHKKLTVNLISDSKKIKANTDVSDHCINFHVLWDSWHPEVAKVSVLTNTLENIKNRESGVTHARFKIKAGKNVQVKFESEN